MDPLLPEKHPETTRILGIQPAIIRIWVITHIGLWVRPKRPMGRSVKKGGPLDPIYLLTPTSKLPL
jgi:hypothetical protein